MVVGNNYAFKSPEALTHLARALALIGGPYGEGAGVSTAAIAKHLGLSLNTAYTYCAELRERGQIHMRRKGSFVTWVLGKDPDPRPPKSERRSPAMTDKPNRPTVSTWTPHHSRDPLVALLFGASK